MAKKRTMEFIYSASIAYEMVLGGYTLHLYYADALVYSLITPYDEDEIFEIHTAQVGDVMWIVHPAHAPRKLKRIGVSEFELEEISFTDGPFLTRNDLIDPFNISPTEIECDVTEVGEYGTLTASTGVFDKGHVGALFKLTHTKTTIFVSTTGAVTSSELSAKGSVRFVCKGTWTGTVKWQRNENDRGWEDFRTYSGKNNYNPTETIIEKEDNVKFRIAPVAGMTLGYQGELLSDENRHSGIVRVIGYGSSRVVAVQVVTRLESTDATVRWSEGSWSDYRGWPGSVTFFQGRCCYAGALSSSEKTVGAEIEYPTLIGITS
ncbi:MAG: hypothetical protein WC554_16370 [Clostridia bacterium]